MSANRVMRGFGLIPSTPRQSELLLGDRAGADQTYAVRCGDCCQVNSTRQETLAAQRPLVIAARVIPVSLLIESSHLSLQVASLTAQVCVVAAVKTSRAPLHLSNEGPVASRRGAREQGSGVVISVQCVLRCIGGSAFVEPHKMIRDDADFD